MSKDLADQYAAEIQQAELHEHIDKDRVSMTVRVDPETKARIERIAEYTGKSMNTVASDILYHSSIEVAVGIAERLNLSTEQYKELAYGEASC